MNGTVKIGQLSSPRTLRARLADYAQLFKLRLTSLVVFSTFVGYMVSAGSPGNYVLLMPLLLGGFLTVAAANAINQVIERQTDQLMARTLNRPVATGRMSVAEALTAAVLAGLLGVGLIGFYLNELSALLAAAGLLVYAFLYTPLKPISGISVWVGGLAGAIPPLVGVAAATGSIDAFGWTLFVIQFFWQFPHFYTIAWVLDDEYKKAGLKLMPIGGHRNRLSAWQIAILTSVLVPVALIPAYYGVTTWITGSLVAICGAGLVLRSVLLLRSLTNRDAKGLMLASFAYLPIVLIVYLIEFLIK
ncbi:MAG: protoheme IX farnesyltransferase [Bacteroidetes bacterium]|nr:protoheme IX farnesyltransferase [Bacteroidota bacterium]